MDCAHCADGAWTHVSHPNRHQALFDTEGRVTVSTDQTSGSSWEAAADSTAHQSYVMPPLQEGDAARAEEDDPTSRLHAEVTDQQVVDSNDSAAADRHDAIVEEGTESPERLDLGSEDLEDQAEATPSASEAFRSSLHAAEVEAIEFRVIRPGNPVRRLRLTGNRYTFGSAEGCSIRLTDHGLRPMHAVLIRDASRILVRAYSVPVQVNGNRTTEATLLVGDVLKLGAYQFELVASEHTPSEASTEPGIGGARPFRSIFDVPAGRTPHSESASSHLFGDSDSSPAEDLVWKGKLRREVEQWRERQVECDRREGRIDERETTLRDRESELWSRAENLYRRESRLQSQEAAAFQLYDEFSKRQQELIDLREAAHRRQETFHQRETAFRNQELEYRERIDEASRQLHQSQQQAENATESVQRMREQFDALNNQIDQLTNQHSRIEEQEGQHREQHEHLRAELERSRDKAIDGQAQSEVKRRDAESRLEELEGHLESLKDGRGSDIDSLQAKLVESEQASDELRREVDRLQQSLSDATDESVRLKVDYEEAFASVVQLESMIASNTERGDKDREDWESEGDELRAAVERLSMELTKANRDLGELRTANEQLTARLDDLQHQRDEARAEVESRPTTDAFLSLQDDFSVATEQLSQTREDLSQTREDLLQTQEESETTRQQLEQAHVERQRDHERAEESLAKAIAALDAANEVSHREPEALGDVDAEGAYENSEHTEDLEASADQAEAEADTDCYEIVDVVDECPDDTESMLDDRDDDADQPANHLVIEEEIGTESEAGPASSWNLEKSNHDAAPVEAASETDVSAWSDNIGEEDPIDADEFQSEPYQPEAAPSTDQVWNEAASEAEPSSWSADQDDNEVHTPEAQDGESGSETDHPDSGSLASMLIKDLESDLEDPANEQSHVFPEESDSGRYENDASIDESHLEVTAESGWDNEHREEAYASEWSNDPDGYSVEEIDQNSDSFESESAEMLDKDSIDEEAQTEELELLESQEEHPIDSIESDELNESDEREEDAEGSTSALAVQAPDDDSIEAYMNRLLRRAKGDPLVVAPIPDEPSPETMEQPQVEPPAENESDSIELIAPRSRRPEQATSLSAMRELANNSARIAITRSVRMQSRDTQIKGMVSYASAIGALACGIACYFFIPGVMRYVAVAMTVIVAGIYVREGFILFRDATRSITAAEQGPMSPASEETKTDDTPQVDSDDTTQVDSDETTA